MKEVPDSLSFKGKSVLVKALPLEKGGGAGPRRQSKAGESGIAQKEVRELIPGIW